MPVLDTEVLFALEPSNGKHRSVLKFLTSAKALTMPDASLFEFQTVLRTRGRDISEIRLAILAVRDILLGHGVQEAGTINSTMIARQCDLESRYGLTFFDSLIAASALALDSVIVSDDRAFDVVPGVTRIPLR
jgi:predicted nucleic acid-binding protein